MDFGSLGELYTHVLPALNTRVSELQRLGFLVIKELDIWNYFSEFKWKESKSLSVSEMVNDILNVDPILIVRFKNKD